MGEIKREEEQRDDNLGIKQQTALAYALFLQNFLGENRDDRDNFTINLDELSVDKYIPLVRGKDKSPWTKKRTLEGLIQVMTEYIDYLSPNVRINVIGLMAQAEIYLKDYEARQKK